MAGSSNTYKVGLHNVGSYQVSGRPWLKSNTIADEEVQYYLLPNVSKTLHVCNDHNAASHDMLVAFPEPRMAANLFDTGNNNFTATFDSLETLTLSVWFKFENTTNTRLLDLTDLADNSLVRVQNAGNKLKLSVNGTFGVPPAYQTGNIIVANQWHHIVVTVSKTNSTAKLYFDGAFQGTVAVAISDGVKKIALGHYNGTNFDGLYSDIFLFDDELGATEAADLFNGVGNINPREHSRASNLISWWAFENNAHKNYFTPADTGTTVFDRISSNNLTLLSGGGGTPLTPVTYEIGRHASSIFNENKCYILSGQEQADFNFKTSLVAVKAVGGSLGYSIYGSLTGIPASRLRGTGLYD